MKIIRELMMSRSALIGFAIIIVVILIGIVISTNSTVQSNQKEELKNMTNPKLPESVNVELDRLHKEKPFVVNRWEIDENQKKIVVYIAWTSARQINATQDKQIGDWMVKIVPDTAMMKEMDAVWAEMRRLEKDPEMQIAASEMHAGDGRIEIFVYLYNYTPGNRELLKNGIRGWKVDGGPITTRPLPPAGTTR